MAFTRDAWNALIDQVNALITTNSLSAAQLVEVPKGHVWTKTDVTLIRNKLTEICTNNPTFAVTLNKWSQKLMTELSAAISGCACQKKKTVAYYLVTFTTVITYSDFKPLDGVNCDTPNVTPTDSSSSTTIKSDGTWLQLWTSQSGSSSSEFGYVGGCGLWAAWGFTRTTTTYCSYTTVYV